MRRAAIDRVASEMAHKGMRILAVATSPTPIEGPGEFQRLTFVALIGIKDPLRPEAAESVRALQEAGVQVVMEKISPMVITKTLLCTGFTEWLTRKTRTQYVECGYGFRLDFSNVSSYTSFREIQFVSIDTRLIYFSGHHALSTQKTHCLMESPNPCK